jgi:putative oxidoreductase
LTVIWTRRAKLKVRVAEGAIMANGLPRARAAHSGAADDIAKLLLRVLIGVQMLLHGFGKIAAGPDKIIATVARAGLPDAFGYLVYVGEVLAPALVIAGVWTRAAAIVIAINMVFAILLVHKDALLKLTGSGGWALELQGFYLFVAVAVALLGAGRYSVGGPGGRWN